MSWPEGERLYGLLPAHHRIRDAEKGYPLRTLMAVMESELETVETDIARLYENWFIETCQSWVVPYIAELLGERLITDPEGAGEYDLRAYVANTLRYRRRKGTATVLEQVARDVTHWPARAVEYFQRLSTTQYMNHIRPKAGGPASLRDSNALEWVDGPFETVHYTADVRHIDNGRGRYNIPNVGIFLWRLIAHHQERSHPREVNPGPGRYTFHPMGRDVPLFNRPRTETEITHLAEETDVPGPLRRRALFDDLNAYRERRHAGESDPPTGYFGVNPVFEVYVNGDLEPLPPEQVAICDLGWDEWDPADGPWPEPPRDRTYERDGEPYETPVAVDPQRGRLLALADGEDARPEITAVSYGYSSPAEIGGGPYNRRASVQQTLGGRGVDWQIGVAKEPPSDVGAPYVDSLQGAVDKWHEWIDAPGVHENPVGVIAITDSATYDVNLVGDHAVRVPEKGLLLIVAADWPEAGKPGDAPKERWINGRLDPEGPRPHLLGDLSVVGDAGDSTSPGTLAVNGLWIEGNVKVLAGNLGLLELTHTTVVACNPGDAGGWVRAEATAKNGRLEVSLIRSIVGKVGLVDNVPRLTMVDTIVDRAMTQPDARSAPAVTADEAVVAKGAVVTVRTSTVHGTVAVRELTASESIFTGHLNVERRQAGCVRFSFVPHGSRTPRRFKCQPDETLKASGGAEEQAWVLARVRPMFTDTDFPQPAYFQLATACAVEIRTGAEYGLEMGAYHHRMQPRKEAMLRQALSEYLPFGLEAGTFFVT